eukprot:Gb_16581 [translate_table: standard]
MSSVQVIGVLGGWKEWEVLSKNDSILAKKIEQISAKFCLQNTIPIDIITILGDFKEWNALTRNQKNIESGLIRLNDHLSHCCTKDLNDGVEVIGVLGGWKEWEVLAKNQSILAKIIERISAKCGLQNNTISINIITILGDFKEWNALTGNQKNIEVGLIRLNDHLSHCYTKDLNDDMEAVSNYIEKLSDKIKPSVRIVQRGDPPNHAKKQRAAIKYLYENHGKCPCDSKGQPYDI